MCVCVCVCGGCMSIYSYEVQFWLNLSGQNVLTMVLFKGLFEG